MNPAVLAMLVLFNQAVAEYHAMAVPKARIFVGAQVGDAGDTGAYSYTTCVAASKVFVVQADEKLLAPATEPGTAQDIDPKGFVRFAAAHEVCHVLLHGRLLCGDEDTFRAVISTRRHEMENEANICALRLVMQSQEQIEIPAKRQFVPEPPK